MTFQYLTMKMDELENRIRALEQGTCKDAISRTAVLNTLDTMDKALDENRTVEEYKELLRECYKQLPPVKVYESEINRLA